MIVIEYSFQHLQPFPNFDHFESHTKFNSEISTIHQGKGEFDKYANSHLVAHSIYHTILLQLKQLQFLRVVKILIVVEPYE